MWSQGPSWMARAFLAGCALVAALGQLGSSLSADRLGAGDLLVFHEPPAARAFIASQQARDAITASRVTSPLYRAEMRRRGHGDDWPLDGLWVEATSQLDFGFVGAVSDASGFTYALYTARPKQPTADSPTSLWRIDLDPDGRVIWGELARVFDSSRVEVVSGARAGALADGPWPIVLGVRSAAGDAYVALDSSPGDGERIAFAQLDASGELGPSYWSFGEPLPTRDSQLHPVDSRQFDLDGLSDDQVQTLRGYLGELEWSPGQTAKPARASLAPSIVACSSAADTATVRIGCPDQSEPAGPREGFGDLRAVGG